MEYPFKEVDFATYCPKCKYEDVEDMQFLELYHRSF